MKITYEDFVGVCPSAMTPETSVFDSLGVYLASHETLTRIIVTPAIYDGLDAVENDLQNPDYDRLVRLRNVVIRYICASAYHVAIPQLDLVLTPTGFGVVSNQNVAPASADRVRELRNEIHRLEMSSLDEMIDLLRHFDGWHASAYGAIFIQSLFWRAEHVRHFGVPNPTRADLMERQPDIRDAQMQMECIISPELVKALIKAEATASATAMQTAAITLCRAFTVAWCRHDGSWHQHARTLLAAVENSLDDFPEYRDSQTYKAHHFKRYENAQDDPCFFFG